MSIDIVSLIPLGMDKEWLQKAIRMFPKHDSRKLDYLVNNNFVSNSDGMVAKDWAWRLSFSCSGKVHYKEKKWDTFFFIIREGFPLLIICYHKIYELVFRSKIVERTR